MNDRELLELAAKAAEFKYSDYVFSGETGLQLLNPVLKNWNPLEDDGDAQRLAVKLKMRVDIAWYDDYNCEFTEKTVVSTMAGVEEEPHHNDPYASTRRAIVRAAAEIGRRMK